MLRNTLLFSFLVFISNITIAQHIKIDNGILFSSYNNKLDLPILYDNVQNYAVALGADYLEKKWFYLSSQIGYSKIGGKEENPGLSDELRHVKENNTYIHLNTTWRAYKQVSGTRLFLGLGPYINILVGSKKFKTLIYHDFYDVKTYAGAKAEVGFTHDINKFRIGLTGSYMLSISPTASSVALNLRNNNLGATISIGYGI